MTTDIIPVSEIESELSRIWDSLEGANKMRASLFNLVFYTKKNPRTEYMQTIAKNVIEKFPSRVIFITEDEESDQSYLNTHVSVLPSGVGSSDIACDSIQIDVSGAHKERIPYVLLPHFLPDLPIYVIWGEDPSAKSPLFEALKKFATRLIFDSETVFDLTQFSAQLLDLNTSAHSDIADLNWARTKSWRELLTSTFYTKERLEKLQKSTTVQIVYNGHETPFTCHPKIQALYLQGWLATQLGWELEKTTQNGGKTTYTYSRPGGHIEVTLFSENRENLKAGSILSVDLETEEQNHFSFGRNLEIPNHVSMRFSTLEKCDIPLRYIFAKEVSGGSLVSEITNKGVSTHFLSLLETIKTHKEFSPCED